MKRRVGEEVPLVVPIVAVRFTILTSRPTSDEPIKNRKEVLGLEYRNLLLIFVCENCINEKSHNVAQIGIN